MGDPLLHANKEPEKLSIQNIVDKERNKLQIAGVLKGSKFISYQSREEPIRGKRFADCKDNEETLGREQHPPPLETSRKKAHSNVKEGGEQRLRNGRVHEHELQSAKENHQPRDREQMYSLVQARELKQRRFGKVKETTTLIRLTDAVVWSVDTLWGVCLHVSLQIYRTFLVFS
ncbi:hypothetical protein BGZ94_000628 [Podila epigama]|nr:hypothetical protein BGZ94_000628 [Podila epigama]